MIVHSGPCDMCLGYSKTALTGYSMRSASCSVCLECVVLSVQLYVLGVCSFECAVLSVQLYVLGGCMW